MGVIESGGLRGLEHLLNGLAKLAFGVKHELTGGDDALTFAEAAKNLVIIVFSLGTERDGAGLEFAAFKRNEDGAFFATAENGHTGSKQSRGFKL